MKLTIQLSVFAALLLSFPSHMNATSTGLTQRTVNTSQGCGPSGCHAAVANPQTTLMILEAVGGQVSMEVGDTIMLTLRVSNTQRAAAGVNIAVKTTLQGSANAGAFVLVQGAGLSAQGPELTHNSPKDFQNGTVEFQFKWIAPAISGEYYLHAVGNAVNLNGSRDPNDIWNWMTPVKISVSPASSVNEGFTSARALVSPVPAHSSVTIAATAEPGEPLTIQIINVNGVLIKEMSTVADNVDFIYTWDGISTDGSKASNGTYFVSIAGTKKVTSGSLVWLGY